MAESKVKNKILLVQAPPWGVYAPPLGIAYLVTFLKHHGISSNVFDLNMEVYNCAHKEVKEKWDTQDFDFWASGKAVEQLSGQLEDLANKIISFNTQIIGFSTTFASVSFLNSLLTILKRKLHKNAIILVGGAGPNFSNVRFLFKKDLIDYFIIGEGEYPLLSLLNDIENDKTIQAGSHYSIWKDTPEDYTVCVKASKENGISIDDIPFPTFEEFDLGLYTQNDLLPLISSRGCVRACTFCCDAPLKKPYRSRNPEKVAEEIKHHVTRYNRRRFEFSDLLINGDLNFLDRFCNLLIDRGLDVCWGGQATVRGDMDADLFKKMKKAGCGGLTFGCESFSDRVLKLMRKKMTSQDAKDTFIKAKDAGMQVEINLIVGFPGETDDDIDETIKFIRENAKWIDKINSLNICTIGPGMYIYEHLDEYGIDKSMITDWYAWFTRDISNTIEVRVERHKRLMSVCSELNLNPLWQNIKK